jgi:Fur family peroxide stress response transcriptional regulator
MGSQSHRFGQQLADKGLRKTRARLLLLEFLARRRDHPTVDEILRSLRQAGAPMGPATVYQNLSKLCDHGLVARITGPDGLMHFDGNTLAHPHLSCLGCGSVVDVEVRDAGLEKAQLSCPHTQADLSHWQLDPRQLELRGLCPTCQGR